MERRINYITLGVADLARARAFYEKLGFHASSASQGDIVFFQLGAVTLSIFPREELAKDIGVSAEGGGFSGVTLAHNVATKEEVAVLLAEAEAAGGRIVKPAQDVFWGGHSGYFSDPDGHLWEVAHNPFVTIGPDGVIALPD
jgi:uncharacterized protein